MLTVADVGPEALEAPILNEEICAPAWFVKDTNTLLRLVGYLCP